MPNIKVVGDPQTYEYDLVKSSVIQLGGLYYFKHDTKNLVKVKVEGGGYRLYRITSPLICKTVNGTYEKKSNCIKLTDTEYLDKNHPDTVKLHDGTHTHKQWAVKIHNQFYLQTDPLIVKTSKNYCLKEECIQLNPDYYSKVSFEPNDPNVTNIDDQWYMTNDIRKVVHWDKDEGVRKITFQHKFSSTSGLVSNVFCGFKDPTNPQLSRYEYCYAIVTHTVPLKEYGFSALKGEAEALVEMLEELRRAENEKITEAARKKCNSKFSDIGDDENQAKIIDPNFTTWQGKSSLFGAIGGPIYSKKLSKTGGIGYTFGVEFETSAGVLRKRIASDLEIEAVGDRSIGAAEYVTMPLQGDDGIDHLKKIADALAAEVLVDDRCAIHVHVGSPNIDSASKWNLAFDRRFAVAAIKLGTILEEELYQTLPKSRNPYNRHCHSIQRYSNINLDNWKEMLGSFVFGPEENWSRPLDTRLYKYGEDNRNKSNSLHTWCGGRYKWLNLVRCYSNCSSPTIEYRIWSPSTSFDKIYNFVLLSLAYTYVADNHYREVMKGDIDLIKLIQLAYHDYPEIVSRLTSFVSERKNKFKRTEIYTGVKPKDLITIVSDTLKTNSCSTSLA